MCLSVDPVYLFCFAFLFSCPEFRDLDRPGEFMSNQYARTANILVAMYFYRDQSNCMDAWDWGIGIWRVEIDGEKSK